MFAPLFQSLGVPADLAARLDHAELHWRFPTALWIGLPLLAFAAVWIDRRHRASLPGASPWARLALGATRTLTLALLLVVLAGPTLTLDETVVRKPIVAVLVDRSQSMQLPANYESEPDLPQLAAAYRLEGAHGDFLSPEAREKLRSTPRIQFLYRLLLGPGEAFWTKLAEKYEVRFYDFADGVERLELDFASPAESEVAASSVRPASEQLGEKATRIDEAIARAVDEAAGRSIAGLILLSDGQEAGGTEPTAAGLEPIVPPAPVFAVPIGSSMRFRDVSIVSFFAPPAATRGDRVAVSVVLESQGFAGRTVPVELWDDATRLDVVEIVLRDGEQQPCELHFAANAAGLKRLTVRTPSQPEEPKFLQANNSESGAVRVVDDRLRVLLVDGQPRWDYRFLKNAMSRDHGLAGLAGPQPDRVLEAEVKRLSPDQRRDALPRDAGTLSRYHAIVLGDATRELLDDAFCEALATAVTRNGVGLIVAAGPKSVPHTLPPGLADLLPVKVAAPVDANTPAGISAPAFAPFRFALTPAGALVEPLRLSLDPEQNAAVWNDLPPFYWCAAVERPTPGATILAVNRALDGPYGPLPLIASQRAGRGKVMFLGTDSTWLWRRNVGERHFYKFWGQALRYVARTDDREAGRTTLSLDPATVSPERPTTIELFAYAEDGAPATDARAAIRLESPNGLDESGATRATIDALPDPATPGRFVATFSPYAAGEHLVSYDPGGGRPLVEARLWVVDRADELRRPNVNLAALERRAASSGGAIVPPPAFDELPSRLAGEARTVARRVETTLWDNGFVLALLAGVYCLDVALRRWWGWN